MVMSPGQVRVVDPVLTNVARGYTNPMFVGGALFPRVPVAISGGQIIEFGKEAFRLYSARRTPGSATKRVMYGHAGKPFALVQDALEGKVPREWMRDAAVSPGVELGTRAVNNTLSAIGLALEYEQATLARTAASYAASNKVALTATTTWANGAHADSDPQGDVEAAKEAIRAKTGQYPNVIVLSATTFAALKSHEKVMERIKYTGRDSVTTDLLASLWDIPRVVVGRAVFAAGADDAFQDVWGNDTVLAYAPEQPSGMEMPSYGYTYTMEGHPLVEQAYWDGNEKSWIYPITMERAAVIAGAEAGYLIQNTGAAPA
jgi:hypothetical protein